MKLKLNCDYDYNNPKGKEFEVLDMMNNSQFRLGIGVLVFINDEESWLTIDWFTMTTNF